MEKGMVCVRIQDKYVPNIQYQKVRLTIKFIANMSSTRVAPKWNLTPLLEYLIRWLLPLFEIFHSSGNSSDSFSGVFCEQKQCHHQESRTRWFRSTLHRHNMNVTDYSTAEELKIGGYKELWRGRRLWKGITWQCDVCMYSVQLEH